jgi:amidase
LGALASIAGLPQVSLPLAETDGCPFGVSLIGPRGSDRALLAAAVQQATNREGPS